MPTDEFERAFADFLDGNEYDKAEDALFSMLRSAFYAGWEAGRKADKVVRIVVENA